MEEKKFHSNDKYFTVAVYTVIVFAICCILFQLIIHSSATIAQIKSFLSQMNSFVIGLLIAFIVNPFVKYVYHKVLKEFFHMDNNNLCKILAIALTYIIVLGFIAICLVYIIPQVIRSISELASSIPLIYASFSRWIRTFSYESSYIDNQMVNDILQNINPKIMEFSSNLVSQIIPMLYSISVSVVQWFVAVVLGLVISIYLVSDRHLLIDAVKKCVYAFTPTKEMAEKIFQITSECNQIFTGYIIAKLIDSLIIGVLCLIIMSILHLPYALLISVIVGVTNMIPYFGPYIGAIPGILILAVSKLRYGLEFTVLIFILQQFDGLILGPKLLGNSTGVRPIVILFAIIFGGAYFGVIGMFLGVPVIAVIQHLISRFINHRLRKKNIDFHPFVQ